MGRIRHIHKADYIDGGCSGYIFHLTTDDRRPVQVQFTLDDATLLELARVLRVAGHAGHAAWHRQNPSMELPCHMCSGEKGEA